MRYKNINYSVDVLKSRLIEIANNEQVIIYGAHLVALETYRYLKLLNADFCCIGFAVSSMKDNPTQVMGQRVGCIDEYCTYKNPTVVIAVPEKYHQIIKDTIIKNGFKKYICLGLENLSILKGQYLIAEYQLYAGDKYKLSYSENDYSWLDMLVYGDEKKSIRKYKFPILYYLNHDEMLNILASEPGSSFTQLVKNKRCNKTIGKHKPKQISIYMVFCKFDYKSIEGKKYPDFIIPIHVGSDLAEEDYLGIRDDDGENISELNPLLAETTAAYWIWKNDKTSCYKGLCHYRRHFDLSYEELEEIAAGDIDAVLTTPRYAPGGIERMFLEETPVKCYVMNSMKSAVKKLYPDIIVQFETFLRQSIYCPNNMVIAKNSLYDDYCNFMFSIIFEMIDIDKKSGYGHENDRHTAYAAELLTSFYFWNKRDSLNIDYRDYIFTK